MCGKYATRRQSSPKGLWSERLQERCGRLLLHNVLAVRDRSGRIRDRACSNRKASLALSMVGEVVVCCGPAILIISLITNMNILNRRHFYDQHLMFKWLLLGRWLVINYLCSSSLRRRFEARFTIVGWCVISYDKWRSIAMRCILFKSFLCAIANALRVLAIV